MNRVFADSFYFFAVLNPKDDAHRKALEFATRHEEPVVTTAWVLTDEKIPPLGPEPLLGRSYLSLPTTT